MFAGYLYKREGSTYELVHSNNLFFNNYLNSEKNIEVYDGKWHKGVIKYSINKGGYYFHTINGNHIILYSSLSPWC